MKLLFICTHNRCRSILSEAILNHMSDGRFEARSAGSQPSGEVHPLTLKYLAEAGIATANLRSQSWDEFEAWGPDVVVTVCDSAAGEACPVWFAKTIRLHWGLADPSKVLGSEETKAEAFRATIKQIQARTQALIESEIFALAKNERADALEALTKRDLILDKV